MCIRKGKKKLIKKVLKFSIEVVVIVVMIYIFLKNSIEINRMHKITIYLFKIKVPEVSIEKIFTGEKLRYKFRKIDYLIIICHLKTSHVSVGSKNIKELKVPESPNYTSLKDLIYIQFTIGIIIKKGG